MTPLGSKVQNMEVETIEVHENVHQCFDQPFGFTPPKSHKKQIMHRNFPISNMCSIWVAKTKTKKLNQHQDEKETQDTRGLASMSQPYCWKGARMTLTRLKWGLVSPLGLPKF